MTHSLQQFFTEAQALRLKYGFDSEHYDVSVDTELKEENGARTFECVARLIRGNEWIAFGSAVTPAAALASFERDLAGITGKVLDDIAFEVEPDAV